VLAFIGRRLAVAVPLLLLASFLVFVLVASSGDPLENLRLNPRTPAAVIAKRSAQLHLDRPVVVRYAIWLNDAVHGDLGTDNNGGSVGAQLYRALPVTLRLVLAAEVLAVLIGVGLGVLSATKQYSWFDLSTTTFSFVAFALPVFWLAAVLKDVGIRVNRALGHRVFFTVQQQTPGLHGSTWTRVADALGHLVLPAFTLVVVNVATYSRFQRASMLDVQAADYVRTARGKGLSETRVTVRHALRNALIPVTTLVALDFGQLLGGAVLTERVFQWKGMGTLLVTAVSKRDVNLMQAWLVVIAVTVVVFNLLADVLYGVLDPRTRRA
jgi:peptide/nickel transport system permease protein